VSARSKVQRGGVGEVGWLVANRPVSPELAPFVSALQGYVERSAGTLRRRELPAPQCVVIIEIGPPIRVFESGQALRFQQFDGGFVAGVDDQSTITEYCGVQSGVQLNLTPIGGRVLFGMPMHELARRVVPLREVWPDCRNLAAELRDLDDWDARFDRIEAALRSRLSTVSDRTRMVAWAFARIVDSGGRLSATSLVRELGYSHKHVIDMFRDQIGLSPKALARLVRFHELTRALRSRNVLAGWAELATELGFTDQAHLGREVRRHAGLTPTQLRCLVRAPLVADPEG
jgi:AraC-like DNA-binding protein